MDIKNEVEVKEELLESSEEEGDSVHSFQRDSQIEIQKCQFSPNITVMEDLEMKEDPLDIKEDDMENSEDFFEQLSGLDDNQVAISDENHKEKDERLVVKKTEKSEQNDDNSSLKTHLLKESNKKVFKCCECSYESNQRGCMKAHILTHGKFKIFKCSECTYACNQKSSLQRHMLTHSNRKLFECTECSYGCNEKGYLRRHMLTHANITLYKCSDCSYESNHRANFKSHMLTHVRAKLFKCSMCTYECNQKAYLKKHMVRHTKKKLLKCSECNFKCICEKSFKKHTFTHPGAVPTSLLIAKWEESSLESSKQSPQPQTEIPVDPIRVSTNKTQSLHEVLSELPESDPSTSEEHHGCRYYSYDPREGKRIKWSMSEKVEVYWCSLYARHHQFPKQGITRRMREMLLKRGVLDRNKVENTVDSRFYSIAANVKMGKTKVTEIQMHEVDKEVEEYINTIRNKGTSDLISSTE